MGKLKNNFAMKRIKTFLTVVVTLLFVSANAQNDISGQLLYHDSTGAPLPDVQLELYDSQGNYISTTYTDENGEYVFSDLAVGTYDIEPSYDAQAGGVDMGDANLILLNLLGLYEFTPIEELASDVDADGEVTWDDYWFIIIDYFIFGEDFPAGDWVFEDISITLGAKEGGDDDNNNDYGSSAGDVQGSWEPGQRSEPFVEASYKNYSLTSGSTTSIDVKSAKQVSVSGAGLVINYPSDMINIVDAVSPFEEAEILVKQGQIRMAWTTMSSELMNLDKNTTLLTLEIEAQKELTQPVKLTLSDDTHFSGEQGQILKDATVQLPVINQNQNNILINGVYPNPVKAESQIDFSLAEAANVKITLMDLSGKTVQVLANRNFGEGSNKVMFSGDNMAEGIYLYEFYLNDEKINKSGKVIIAD